MLFPRGDDEGSTIYEISINKTGTFAFQNIIDYMADHDELGRLVMKALQKRYEAEKVKIRAQMVAEQGARW